ncbi:MAG: adenylate/guanylate cyclase domain-containing protein [Proteobacteria bacterium]|nr:adenylate/guanylate cyclase domain-containing protein [Pseudomonadota bacterium]
MHQPRLIAAITDAALAGAREDQLLDRFCTAAVAEGLPLFRAAAGIDTLHPVLDGRLFVWRRGGDAVQTNEFRRQNAAVGSAEGSSKEYKRSPFYRLFENREIRLRRRVGDNYQQGEFPVLDDIVAAGGTDYLVAITRFESAVTIASMDCIYTSWTTDRAGGFSDGDIDTIERALPSLATALKSVSLERIAETVLETYLGRDAGRRVLKGNISRGVAEPITAVLWLSDLQSFTKIAEEQPPADIIPFLNDYADCLVQAIHANGGQVMKFIGDGLLAIFDIDRRADACRRAVKAADLALKSVAQLNEKRSAKGLPTTRFDLALHIGEVYYGNIGSADRLDFTVVGPAVNELARIEAMCRSLERDVIVSTAFHAGAMLDTARLVSVGRYALRGVRAPEELFTLLPDED